MELRGQVTIKLFLSFVNNPCGHMTIKLLLSFCQQSSPSPSFMHPGIKFQWLSAMTMLTSFLPLLKNLNPQKMIKGRRLSQKAGNFVRTM